MSKLTRGMMNALFTNHDITDFARAHNLTFNEVTKFVEDTVQRNYDAFESMANEELISTIEYMTGVLSETHLSPRTKNQLAYEKGLEVLNKIKDNED